MADVDWAGFTQIQRQNQQINNPLNGFAQGFQIGAVMRQQNAINKARELEAIQNKQLMDRQALLQSSLSRISAMQDPNEKVLALTDLGLQFPEMSKNLNEASKTYSENAKTTAKNTLMPILSAIKNGRYDLAKSMTETASEAFKNSGNTKASNALRDVSMRIENGEDLGGLFNEASLYVSSILGWDETMAALKAGAETARADEQAKQEVSQTAIKAEQAKQEPLVTQIKQAELERQPFLTKKAQVEADFANSNAALELQKKGWDITKIQNDIDISKQNSRIAAMNAQFARENNDLKKQELALKIADAQQKRDSVFNEKVAKVESARSGMDNMLNTAQRILKTPMSVIESATGPISTRFPTLSQDTADFEELVDNLKSQAFLAQIPNIKGMGALSNAEGDKLQQALQNFNLRQSPTQLLGNIKEAQRLVLKARSSLAKEYGVPESSPDVPAAKPVVKRTK